jgi:hypothetical protein
MFWAMVRKLYIRRFPPPLNSHVGIMSATEFERFHKHMTNPKRPSKAMIEAAKLHRLLVSGADND